MLGKLFPFWGSHNIPSLNLSNIVMIFFSVSVTLLAFKQSFIAFHQSSNIFLSLLNYSGSETIDLQFTISVSTDADAILATDAGILAHILDIFFLDCSTNSTSLNSLSSF